MVDSERFKTWLSNNTNYSSAVIRDVVSRMNRADKMLAWDNSDTYIYYLSRNEEFNKMSASVKSQIRRSVKYYYEFANNSISD